VKVTPPTAKLPFTVAWIWVRAPFERTRPAEFEPAVPRASVSMAPPTAMVALPVAV
jgi:hypothetical protein